MAISFIVKASIQLHCRAIFIPWVQKYSAISCSRGRDYSAFPVRHNPKKPKECQELEAASPRKQFLEIEKQTYVDRNVQETEFSVGGRLKNGGISLNSKSQNHKQRLLTSVDNEVEWGKEDEVNADFRLGRGIAETDKARVDAERIAVQLLASRALTAAEVKKKLLGRNFTISVVNAVITDFHTSYLDVKTLRLAKRKISRRRRYCDRGLINDSLYAEMFSRSRWSSSSWGPRRIKQALIKKGVSEVDADKAVKLVFKNDEAGEEEESGESGVTMSRPSLDQLFVQASKQWLKWQSVSREKRKARIVRWLQYRGFDWSVVSFILKKLESSYPG